jgi:hypothetical protein
VADKPADNKQKTLIHLARTQLGMSEDQYRAAIRRICNGKESAKGLTYDEAHALIEHFRHLGFQIKPKGGVCRAMCAPRKRGEKLPDNVLVLASPAQVAKINRLIADIRWKTIDGFVRWLRKYYGIDRIKYSLEASRVMEGLKGLWKSQHGCKCKLAQGGDYGER